MFTGRERKNTVKYSDLDSYKVYRIIMSREKPTPPASSECCESECSPCVWDTYFEELSAWNAEQAAIKESENQKNKTEST